MRLVPRVSAATHSPCAPLFRYIGLFRPIRGNVVEQDHFVFHLLTREGVVRCATIHNACRSAPFPRPTSKRSCQPKYTKIHSSFRAMPFPCSPLQSPRLSFLGSQVTDLIPVAPCAAFLSNRSSDPFLLIEFTDRCGSVDCIPLYLFSQAERSLSRMAHSAILQFIFAT
jgi:hypothetical protein